jgi:hypothetical protein
MLFDEFSIRKHKKCPMHLRSHRANVRGELGSSFLNTHSAQFFGTELGLEPIPAEEGEQTKADQDCKC